jgi:hypothetical protein
MLVFSIWQRMKEDKEINFDFKKLPDLDLGIFFVRKSTMVIPLLVVASCLSFVHYFPWHSPSSL